MYEFFHQLTNNLFHINPAINTINAIIKLFEIYKKEVPNSIYLELLFQLGTPSGNRTHIYPLGGDCSIH